MSNLDVKLKQLIVQYDSDKLPAFKGDVAAWQAELNMNKVEMNRALLIERIKQTFYDEGFVLEESGQVLYE